MKWIKPSLLWMMYRCGWGEKDGQEVVLAVKIKRVGFDWALRNACLSHYERGVHPDRASWQRELKRRHLTGTPCARPGERRGHRGGRAAPATGAAVRSGQQRRRAVSP
jgi:hypothetical protein